MCFSLLLVTTLAQAQSNPVPFLYQPLVPASTAPGGPGITLTVNGTGFVSGSVVNWNGTPLQTQFVSNSQLTATVPAAMIAAPGTATITVAGAGGVPSNVEFFPISPVTTPTFTDYSVPNPPSGAASIQSAVAIDVNGDGKLDLIGGYADSMGAQMGVSIGNGDGSFQPPRVVVLTPQLSVIPSTVSVGDFNNDGKVDVALGLNGLENFVAVVLGNGDGTFGSPTTLTLQTGYEADFMVVADVNKDGKLDLITGNNLQPNANGTDDATLSIFLGKGDGTFQSPVNYQIGNYLDSMAVGDLNGDGNLDVIASTTAGMGSGFVLLGNGDGTFGSPTASSFSPASQMVLADVNGDGKLDLLAISGLNVYLGNGDGTFGPGVSYNTSGATAVSLTMGDFNADGKLDAAVVVANNNSQDMSILYGNGDGTFQAGIAYPAPSSMFGLVNGDFNGDGRLDLFVAALDGNSLGTVLLQGSFPVLSPAPGSLTFPQQAVNTTSLAQSVTLTNSGNVGVTISKIGVTGSNAGDYAETNNCGPALAVNATCQISVTFTPTGQGTRNAMLSVTDNAPGSPQSIGLTGVTTPAPALTLSPSSIVFPGQFVGTTGLPQTITATNTGGATLTITSVGTSSKDFGVLNACGGSLAAGSSCSIGVFFDPASSGSSSGAVSIADNAGGSPQTVALSGMGQDFSFSASSSTETITPGQTATYTIAVTPIAGFNQAVTLSCAGAPAGSTCSLSSSSVNLAGSTPTSVTVSVTTLGSSARRPAGVENSRLGGRKALYLSLCGFPGLIVLGACRRRPGMWKSGGLCALAFLAVIVVGTTGCGGGGSSGGTGGTPANTYSLTVTGTFASGSANLTHSTKLTLVVQ